jgi:uncharacterized protein (TIGR02284 family)
VRHTDARYLEDNVMAERTEREVLHHLIEICRDGERGYRAAAEHATDNELKRILTELAEERRGFADELTPHLYRLGGLADGGSNAAALHRGWMTVRGWMPHHDHQIIVETERGDSVALEAYEEALNGMLPPTVTGIVEAQRERIRSGAERVRLFEMGYA